jgi:hypothetical protein
MNVDPEKKNQEERTPTPAAVHQPRQRHVVARDDPLRSVGSRTPRAPRGGGDCSAASTRNVELPPMDYCPSKGNGLMASSSDMDT